jgi:hypothetical protein
MRKKTAPPTPENPKASPNQPSGLIAEDQRPRAVSAGEVCP